MQKKTFPASLKHLHEMLAFIHKFALKQGFEVVIADKIMLASEEALVNVIHHGYPSGVGEIEVCCEDTLTKPGMKILIKDFGIPFDPMQEIKKDKKNHKKNQTLIEESAEGGYGIFIYVGLMDCVEYYRTDEGNMLLLIKYL